MRKLILKMECSLDGFVGGERGELDWLTPGFDAEHGNWLSERLWQADAHLMGKSTYLGMASHWPSSTQPYAEPMNRIPKVVFSKTLQAATWGETSIVRTDPAAEILRLKQGGSSALLAHGGIRFGQYLVRSGLVDEYWLVVHPVALGKGQQLFADLSAPMHFEPIDRTMFGSGVTALTFRPSHSHPREA